MGAIELLLVRHGESEANVAATAAGLAHAEVIEVPARDADVVLSETGRDQADAVGRHLAALEPAPQALWVSTYRRAVETAERILAASGLDLEPRLDERLRDRELGILDALTARGVEARYPDEAARRRHVGKFSYRPPGGESWADVAFRARSVLADLDAEEDGRRVLVVCHDAVISNIRYVTQRLTEQELLDDARAHPIPNASVTRLVRPSGQGVWTAQLLASVDHLEAHGAEVTRHGGELEGGDPDADAR